MHEMLVLMVYRVSSGVSCFPLASACMGEAVKPFLLDRVDVSKLEDVSRFEVPTCLVWSLWFSSGISVSMGEAAKPFLFKVVKVSKLEDVSHEMLLFRLPHVSS